MKRICIAISVLFVSAASAVSPEWTTKWHEDLELLRTEIPEKHADLFALIPREQWNDSIDELKALVPDLEHHEITVELARIIASIGDGHTRLTLPMVENSDFFSGHSNTPPPADPTLVFRHYPIRFYLFSDGLFVTRVSSEHKDLLGAKVLQIGDMLTDSAIEAVAPVIQRDNVSQIKRHMPDRLAIPEILHARGVIKDMEKATLVVETRGGEKRTVELTPVAGDPVEWVDALAQSDKPMYLSNVETHFWMKYFENTNTLYWQYNTVYDSDDETITEFADRLLEFLESHPVERLVIDLRHNVGGSNSLNQPLIHTLIRSTKTRAPGSVYAIIGRATFSAAMMFTIDLEKNTHVIFAGEPTGSSTNHYGDSRKTKLPNTGLTVRVSSLYWQYSGPRDERKSIEPHIPVELSSKDYFSGHDPVFAAILETADPDTPAYPEGAWSGRMVDYQVVVSLSESSGSWIGTLDIPSIGLEGLALDNLTVDSPYIRFEIPGEDGPLIISGEIEGHLLVGRVEMGRQRYPFALVQKVH